jgi:hypothetical protein
MTATPRYLIDTLDMIIARKAPSAKAVGSVGSRHITRVRDAFEDKNIVGIGISEKWTEKKSTRALSLCFYVKRKIAKSKLKLHRYIPPVVASREGRAVFTDVKTIGAIRPQVSSKADPIQSGFSVGHVSGQTGTIGAIVKKGSKRFILSNSHILALSGNAKKGDGVAYPGPFDGGTASANLIGKLAEFVPFKTGDDFPNSVDAALAEVVTERLEDLDFTLFGVKGAPASIAPQRGMTVIKRGRTTDDRGEGIIHDVNFHFVAEFAGVGIVGFHDQVLCSRYTRTGDSGALVVDKESGKIVGLHVAGGETDGSIFTPMTTVVSALGFRFATS